MNLSLNFFYPCIEGGGLEKNLFSLINSLALKKKYKINFFTYENNTKDKALKGKFFFHKKINLIKSSNLFKTNHRILKYLLCTIKLYFFLIFKSGIIISFQGNILPIITAKILKKKIIIRCNTAPSKYITNNLKRIFFSYFYSKADIILVTSKDFKKEFKKYFKVNCIIHKQSLDILNIEKKSKTKFSFSFFDKFSGLKLINVGRLTYQKNQMTILKAFEKLVKVRKSRLVLLGSGSDKEILINFIKKKIE